MLGQGRLVYWQHQLCHEDGRGQVCPQEGGQGQGPGQVPRHHGDRQAGSHGDVLRRGQVRAPAQGCGLEDSEASQARPGLLHHPRVRGQALPLGLRHGEDAAVRGDGAALPGRV